MAGQYEHLIVRSLRDCREDMLYEAEAAGRELPANLSRPWALMSAYDVPEAKAYLTMSWVNPTDEHVDWVHEHVHDYDEVLTFTGSNPEDANDLGAEVFMTIEGEEHLFTQTGSVYVPAGTRHCPLGFNWVKRPFRFIAVALSGDGYYLSPEQRAEKAARP